MSAGGLSYSALTNYGKMTLPSVESWGNNMNILRDPPKSIMTRRVDKVSDTSSITQMIENSSDRACEAIQVYARGVNPMVAVSYDNASNNGGQRTNGFSNTSSQKSSYLPYRIRDSFRPPVRPPQNLLPLSRLPRIWTSAFTQPGFADFTKKAMCPQSAEKTFGVRNETLKPFVRPTAVYKLETPIMENYEVKHVIQNPVKTSAYSGVRTLDHATRENFVSADHTVENPLHTFAQTNVKGQFTQMGENSMDVERFTHETNHQSVTTNYSQNIEIAPIDEIMDGSNIRTKEAFHIPYTAPKTAQKGQEYIHTPQDLRRSLPAHSARTNIVDLRKHVTAVEDVYRKEQQLNRPNVQAYTNHGTNQRQLFEEVGSRTVKLNPTVSGGALGGFEGRGVVPLQDRLNQEVRTERGELNNRIMEMQRGRYAY